MPARSDAGLVCADCGTPLPDEVLAKRSYSWGSLAAVACAAMLTTGAFVLSSLSSESPSLAETHKEAQVSDAGAAE